MNEAIKTKYNFKIKNLKLNTQFVNEKVFEKRINSIFERCLFEMLNKISSFTFCGIEKVRLNKRNEKPNEIKKNFKTELINVFFVKNCGFVDWLAEIDVNVFRFIRLLFFQLTTKILSKLVDSFIWPFFKKTNKKQLKKYS